MEPEHKTSMNAEMTFPFLLVHFCFEFPLSIISLLVPCPRNSICYSAHESCKQKATDVLCLGQRVVVSSWVTSKQNIFCPIFLFLFLSFGVVGFFIFIFS